MSKKVSPFNMIISLSLVYSNAYLIAPPVPKGSFSIANEIFGDVGFYRIQHKDDKMIQKVLELETNQE